MNLSGHRILVTGGSTGIGLALARAFITRGNRVAICGRSAHRLSTAQAALGDLEIIQCDLSRAADASALAEAAAERLGGVSILVNNAGMQLNYRFDETDPEQVARDVAREIQVNLTSVITLTATCLPLLRAADTAAVINISSSLALAPKADAPVYCATKAAVHSFSQALRYQFEDALPDIRVFEVMPPLVDTDMTRGRGSGKISPDQVAQETCRGVERDRHEIRVGKARQLHFIHRIAPSAAARLLRNT